MSAMACALRSTTSKASCLRSSAVAGNASEQARPTARRPTVRLVILCCILLPHSSLGLPALALQEPIIIAGQNGTLAPCERQERYGLRFVQNPNRRNRMRFEGTPAYVATDDLKVAVNAAITLERPLLVTDEPGTGKTVLALEVAKSLGAPLIEWHIKSNTKALQGLYEYDAVSRLRDS